MHNKRNMKKNLHAYGLQIIFSIRYCFPMQNYNHDVGFHVGIEKGKQTMVDLQIDSRWKLSLEAKVEDLTWGMEEIKKLIVNKHSQRQHKMLPLKGLEYNEGLSLPTHKANWSTKGVYKQGCAKLGTNQTHPSP